MFSPAFISSPSDFSAALECAACDGDIEGLDILHNNGLSMRDSLDLFEDDESALYRFWAAATRSALSYRRAIECRESGEIEKAMKFEDRAGRLDAKMRAALMAMA